MPNVADSEMEEKHCTPASGVGTPPAHAFLPFTSMKLSTTIPPRPSGVDDSTAVGRPPQESASAASSKTTRSFTGEQPADGLTQGALSVTGVARNSLIAFGACASTT